MQPSIRPDSKGSGTRSPCAVSMQLSASTMFRTKNSICFSKAFTKSSMQVKSVISPVFGPIWSPNARPLFSVISITFATLNAQASCQPSYLCAISGSTQPEGL